jgi:hypothetical protein
VSRAPAAAPRLLLSARSLDGVTRIGRERLIEIHRRFDGPESLAVTLVKAVEAGADGVLSAPSPALRAALAELGRPLPIFAVLPSLSPQEYRMLEPGVEPLLRQAAKSAGPVGRARMGLRATLRLAALRRGDYAVRVPMLLEADAHRLPGKGLAGVVIAAPLTDTALAGDHRAFFETVLRFVRRRFRALAGLETRNGGVLLERLRAWGLAPDFVVAPMNPCGLGMKPSPQDLLDELAKGGVPFLATELRAGGICPLGDGAAFALEHGAHGLAPDLAEMDEVSAELKRLAAPARS